MARTYEDKVAAAAQQASDTGAELYDRAKEKVQSAADYARDGLDKAVREGRRQAETVSDAVRKRPLMSVGIAFLAGCALSHLLRR
jgi:ElaB/YqjD/DUF883 family membrane-anchored ribosome-binding protein